jgi:hypothetical protein
MGSAVCDGFLSASDLAVEPNGDQLGELLLLLLQPIRPATINARSTHQAKGNRMTRVSFEMDEKGGARGDRPPCHVRCVVLFLEDFVVGL